LLDEHSRALVARNPAVRAWYGVIGRVRHAAAVVVVVVTVIAGASRDGRDTLV